MTQWDWPWIFSQLALASTGFIVLPLIITEGRLPALLLARWRVWRAR